MAWLNRVDTTGKYRLFIAWRAPTYAAIAKSSDRCLETAGGTPCYWYYDKKKQSSLFCSMIQDNVGPDIDEEISPNRDVTQRPIISVNQTCIDQDISNNIKVFHTSIPLTVSSVVVNASYGRASNKPHWQYSSFFDWDLAAVALAVHSARSGIPAWETIQWIPRQNNTGLNTFLCNTFSSDSEIELRAHSNLNWWSLSGSWRRKQIAMSLPNRW